MKAYKVWIEGANPFVEADMKNVMAAVQTYLEESDTNNRMTIETIETIDISEEDYNNLPEWDGP